MRSVAHWLMVLLGFAVCTPAHATSTLTVTPTSFYGSATITPAIYNGCASPFTWSVYVGSTKLGGGSTVGGPYYLSYTASATTVFNMYCSTTNTGGIVATATAAQFPSIGSFFSSPATFYGTATITLSWSGCTSSATISGGVGNKMGASGSTTVSASATTTWTAYCETDSTHTLSTTATQLPSPSHISSFTSSPSSFYGTSTITLSWAGCTSYVTIGGTGYSGASGSATVSASGTTTWTAWCEADTGHTLSATSTKLPSIASFTEVPSSFYGTATIALSWTGCTSSVNIGGTSHSGSSGSTSISISSTTSWTAYCESDTGHTLSLTAMHYPSLGYFATSPTSFSTIPHSVLLEWAGCTSYVTIYSGGGSSTYSGASGSTGVSVSATTSWSAWCETDSGHYKAAQATYTPPAVTAGPHILIIEQ